MTNLEKALNLLEAEKAELKKKKEEKLRAETRIEENEKGLKKDYEEVKLLGYDPEKIDEVLEELDETLMSLEGDIQDIITKLEK